MTVELIEGDSRDVLREFADNSIDSCVTDPPYALVSISKRFGKEGSAAAKVGKTGAYARASAGFMGKTWDTGETAFDPAFWEEVLRVLKPGGHVLAFGGTRTYHRLACAIEDAGFEIRDQIGWLYGSGFPKSHNQSGEWEGWGTALKPAWEPIVVARKWLDGTNAANLAKWGVGALNIDGCRVEFDGAADQASAKPGGKITSKVGALAGGGQNDNARTEFVSDNTKGRWPANIIHDGSDEVLAAFPQAPGQIAKAAEGGDRRKDQNVYGAMTRGSNGAEPRAVSGSAARFFYCAKANKRDRNDGLDSSAIVSISGAWENADQKVTLRVATGISRPKVTDVFGASMNSASEWSTLLFGSGRTGQFQMVSKSTTKTKISSTIASTICNSLATFATSGCTPVATLMPPELSGSRAENAEFIDLSLTTTSEKMASALGVNRVASKMPLRISVFVPIVSSSHPTVKPTDLMRYLCRLVTPPGGTVLDPFMGSGSTGRGAVMEGFSFIGIEMDAGYYDIADARIAAVEPKAEATE